MSRGSSKGKMMTDSSTMDIILKVAQFVAIIGSLGVGLFTIGRSSSRVEAAITNQAQDLIDMKAELKKLADVITQQAVQSSRIDNINSQIIMIQRTIEDLRRGSGYIIKNRQIVDGEHEG
jgi:hypothetical protein